LPRPLRYRCLRDNSLCAGFKRISWEEALDFIADRFKKIAAKHGWPAIAWVLGSPGAGTTKFGAYLRLASLTRSTRVSAWGYGDAGLPCGSRVIFGTQFPFGFLFSQLWFGSPDADMILVWGANPGESQHLNLMRPIMDAKERGARLVVIDPRYTVTASKADQYVGIKAGTDAALITKLAERIGRSSAVIFVTHMGLTRTFHGDISFRGLASVATLTGNITATFKGGYLPAVLNWRSFLKAKSGEPSYKRLGILQLYDAVIKGITREKLKEGAMSLMLIPEMDQEIDMPFSTPSGKIELYSESLYEEGQALPVFAEPLETPVRPEIRKYPLAFIQGHSRFRTHSMFANVESLLEMNPEPVVEINPQDAAGRNIANEEKVVVFNDRARTILKAKLTEGVRPGVINITQGWWIDQFQKGSVNHLTHDVINPIQEKVYEPNMHMNDVAVEVAKYTSEKEV